MDPFLGEIRAVAFPFAPKNWAYCQGQLLSVAQNQALFQLLGTTFEDNGQTTFGLPDLRGRIIIGVGMGPGRPGYAHGQQGGQESVTLTTDQAPAHTHSFSSTVRTGGGAGSGGPANNYPAEGSITQFAAGTPTAPPAAS